MILSDLIKKHVAWTDSFVSKPTDLMAFPKSGSSHAGLAVDPDILLENSFLPNDKMSLSPAGLNLLGSSSVEYARVENKHLFVSKIGITFEFETLWPEFYFQELKLV